MNCLGYAIGLDSPETYYLVSESFDTFPERFTQDEVISIVSSKFLSLGFESRLTTETASLQDSEMRIAFWGLIPLWERDIYPHWEYDFHFAKQQVSGEWTHKWGIAYSTSIVTLEELNNFYQLEPVFFAIKQKAP